MGRRSGSTLPARVNQLRRRIERWRRQRTQRSPMAEDLWASAVSLAQKHGVYPIARALGIDYGALKKRAHPPPRKATKAGQVRTDFIELSPTALLGRSEPAGVTIELSDGDGSRLVVRVPSGEVVDVESVVRAFWSRG